MTAIDSNPFELARQMFADDVASRAAGVEIVEIGTGHATATMTVTETMVNGHGITHGGYVFLLADTTFALACNSHGERAVGARADIRYILPTRRGETLTAIAEERIRFGRNGIYDVTVVDEEHRVIAEFRGDSRVISIH
ncbi:hydroxyphenylacetyl-CoA thioesterase PaaI [Nocardia sp. CA-084685]|uniref:hydroxyphenylacetyl-CoA thioesterase PaaI n=1 Tax=Nocardia sp. CA-084685 TaxID=3239970 RepID=UPI003D99A680